MAQDVFSKMAEDQWVLKEDGYLNVNQDIKEIIYHPSLNILLLASGHRAVHVLDVNSGVILHWSWLAGKQKKIVCGSVFENFIFIFVFSRTSVTSKSKIHSNCR